MKSKLKLKRYLLFLPLLPLGTLSLANTYLLQDHNTLTPYTPFTTPLNGGLDVVRAAHLHPSYELVDWKRVGDTKLVALVRSALVRVKFQDTTSSDQSNTNQNALSFDTQESQKALNGSQSGSSDTSGSNSQDF
ncbi:hypothetical protein ACNI8D_03675, partial [Mycoplasmoides pneumoniae]